MTGTLFVRADGTSRGASMVKMSADFASEAPRCQRISSITPQITFDQGVIGGFSQGALGARFRRAAAGRPKCPTRNIQIRPRNHGGFYWREIMRKSTRE